MSFLEDIPGNGYEPNKNKLNPLFSSFRLLCGTTHAGGSLVEVGVVGRRLIHNPSNQFGGVFCCCVIQSSGSVGYDILQFIKVR